MKNSEIFSKRILLSLNTGDRVVKKILHNNKNDKETTILLSIYLIENYFRPFFVRKIEFFLYKYRILKNPTLGPFQIKANLLETELVKMNDESLFTKSLYLIKEWIRQFKMNKKITEENFINFGKYYNGSNIYGKIMLNLYKNLRVLN